MKKYLALALLIFTMGAPTSLADIPVEGMKPIQVCAYFNNTEALLDTVAVWGYETAPDGGKVDLSKFISNECFSLGYKFNSYHVYGTTAKHAADVSADSYDPSTDPEAYPTDLDLQLGMLYVDENSTLTRIMNEYHIVKLDTAAGKLVIEPVLTRRFYGTNETPTIVPGTVTAMSWTEDQVYPPAAKDAVFTDVDGNSKYYDALKYLKDQKIISGYPDGSFKPGNTINRAEFVKIVSGSVATQDELTNCSAHYASQGDYMLTLFSDVAFAMVGGNEPPWYFDFVCIGKLNGFIGGYPDGSFRPANEINFVEAAKIIVEVAGKPTSSTDPWFKKYVEALENKNAIPTTITAFDQKVTRGEMAEIMYRLRAQVNDLPSQTYAGLK